MRPFALFVILCILGLMAFVAMGQSVPMPPTPVLAKNPLHASPSVKGAANQMLGAKASFVAAQVKYIDYTFQSDPNNGKDGYWNRTSYVDTTTDLKTWRQVMVLPLDAKGFSAPINPSEPRRYYRIRTPNWK